MGKSSKNSAVGPLVVVTLILSSPAMLCAESAGVAPAGQRAVPPNLAGANLAGADLAATMLRYRRALARYNKAQQRYAAVAGAYWRRIAEKRHLRARRRAKGEPLALDDYVLAQPPVYAGPPKPRNPLKPHEKAPPSRYVPVVADFLAAARQEFHFTPRLPRSESEFKRAYAAVASAAGLTRNQVVRIYGFEATGNGDYDVEAGLEYGKRGRAITTALGYNQLLATNSVEIMAEHGRMFIRKLAAGAAWLPEGGTLALLLNKISILRKMVDFTRSVADDWNRHQALAGTEKGLGVHTLNLDLDVGPLLQTQKLLDSIVFARRKGSTGALSGAELEMMNLTGDGNGLDMILLPSAWRKKVPTANFFQRSGYRDNPVARRHNVVATLIAATDARMDEEIKKPGARELAAAWDAARRDAGPLE